MSKSRADVIKAKLMKMAMSGSKRPPFRGKSQKDATALYRYTRKGGTYYDAQFTKQLRTARPDWFERSSGVKKAKLLELAKSGAVRPSLRDKDVIIRSLAAGLGNYTNSTNSSYDPDFEKKIRKAAPHWFKRG